MDPAVSVHQQQMEQVEAEQRALQEAIARGEIAPDPAVVEAQAERAPLAELPPAPQAAVPSPAQSDFIVFGYIQNDATDSYTDFYRWNALTHVGSTFIYFNTSGAIANPGSWTGRDEELRAGGAAQAAGTKVIMVVANYNPSLPPSGGFDSSLLSTVMNNSTARSALVDDIVARLLADGYSHGVSFDFEPFSWSSTTRDNMTLFFAELRADLNAAGLTNHEISFYADPTPSSTQWDLPGFEPNLDYLLFSCYDYATGQTPHAISDFDNYTSITTASGINDFYFDGGWPYDKMVMVISSYSGLWADTDTYNVSGGEDRVSRGFTDALWDVTLEPQFGGPYTEQYRTGDEVSWYTYTDAASDETATFDSARAMEYKIRHVLSNQDADDVHNGFRLRGVGFWSLMWLAETSSYHLADQEAGSGAVGRTRTYPHIYQLCEEILSAPGDRRYVMEGFEGSLGTGGYNFRWRQPWVSPDESGDTDNNSSRTIIAKPGGAGSPVNSTTAMQMTFDFESGSGNRLFFRHEVLNDANDTAVVDTNSALAHFDANNAVICQVHTAAAYAGRTVRMVVMEMPGRQLEASDTFSLGTAGWHEFVWDLTDPAQINAYDTNELSFVDGNGVLNTAGGGARDIAFIGFLVEGGAAGVGQVTFDELECEHRNPGGRNYKINEIRYATSASEFIEVHGPSGLIPANTELRIYDEADGSVLQSVPLGGLTVAADGHFVIGDTGVPNVDLVPAGWGAGDNLRGSHSDGLASPEGLQIYNTTTGNVYDSVVYEAMDGIGDLIRPATHQVTGEGYPWLGEISGGTTAGGTPYTMGRYPDGSDTDWNSNDFSVMPASPGVANGGTVPLGSTFDFTTAPSNCFAAYNAFLVGASGVGSSPSGGNVHRCVDTSGGGQQTWIGDAGLGGGGLGYTVTGEVFIPNAAAPAQAIGLGICGRQGSTFFSNFPDSSGYESGYWLIYENVAGVGLNDGRADHNGVFELVLASNDRMDSSPVTLISSKTLAQVGVTAGNWTTFSLTVNPPLTGQQLIVQINGVDVYRGNLPAGGPTSGAVQFGFRENHVGAPAAAEGTWVDNVQINTAVPVELSVFGTE